MPARDLEGAPGTMGWHFLTLMPLQSSRLALSSCIGSALMGPSAAAMEREGGIQQKMFPKSKGFKDKGTLAKHRKD